MYQVTRYTTLRSNDGNSVANNAIDPLTWCTVVLTSQLTNAGGGWEVKILEYGVIRSTKEPNL